MYSSPFSRYDAVYSFMNGTCHGEYTKFILYLGKCAQEAAIRNTKQLCLPHSGFKVISTVTTWSQGRRKRKGCKGFGLCIVWPYRNLEKYFINFLLNCMSGKCVNHIT